VIITQAGISAVIGYAVALVVSAFIVHASESGGAAIRTPWQMMVGIFLLSLAMCIGAAMVSIKKVMHLDPAMVFKG